MESSRQTSVKCLIVIETSLFSIPDFKNYKFVTYSNFPWPNSWKNKDFTAISKSLFFAINFLASGFLR